MEEAAQKLLPLLPTLNYSQGITMSILINKDTKVVTQGITGKTGQFQQCMCRDYANGKNASLQA